MSRLRQNPVRGRQRTLVTAIAVVSGVAAAFAGAAPTAQPVVDAVLVAVSVAVFTWASATAPWWLLTVFASLVGAIGSWYPVLVVALVAAVIAATVGANRRNLPRARALSGALAVNALLHARLGLFHGASAAIGGTAALVVLAWGLRRRQSNERRMVNRVLWGLAVLAAASVLGFALAAIGSRAQLQEGNRLARQGLDQLNRGKVADAASSFGLAADAFARADDSMSAPWAQGVRLLPVAAQHRAAAADVVSVARSAMADAASALRKVNPESVRLVDGRIDLDAVRALEQPFVQLNDSIDRLSAVVGDVESPWLLAPLQREFGELRADLAKNQGRARNALHAVQVAPRMLGGEGLRRYFVAFTTPAEARGIGGFMGTWAELTIDGGRIEMTRYGRSEDVNGEEGQYPERRVQGLDDLLSRWGRFGLNNGPDGTARQRVWSNITMAPHFPAVAEAIAQLYPQSGGSRVDGVFLLDTQAIAALMQFTGPIEVEGVEQPLTAQNANEFLLRGQYQFADDFDFRKDLLQTIARTTVDRLLGSTLPPPADLAAVFAPLAADRRLMAWSADADEQQLLTDVRMDGSFVLAGGGDGIAVTLDNAIGNKIDAYLATSVAYRVVADGPGDRTAEVTVTLTNNAPSEGLPEYVIGNAFTDDAEVPAGTNRTWVSVYTAMPMVAASLDGEQVGMQTAGVFGWRVSSRFIDIPPGATRTFTMQVRGEVDTNVPMKVIRQPLVVTTPVTVLAD
jgi:hypothetical protein